MMGKPVLMAIWVLFFVLTPFLSLTSWAADKCTCEQPCNDSVRQECEKLEDDLKQKRDSFKQPYDKIKQEHERNFSFRKPNNHHNRFSYYNRQPARTPAYTTNPSPAPDNQQATGNNEQSDYNPYGSQSNHETEEGETVPLF